MELKNLKELVIYYPWHISTFARMANVTQELFTAALNGEEEFTSGELHTVAYYLGIPFRVITCPKLIMMNKNNRKHCRMIEELDDLLYTIYDGEKKGIQEAVIYMSRFRQDLVNLQLDFQNNGQVSYCRYLGIKQRAEDIVSWVKYKEKKPRGRKAGAKHA